MESAEANPNRYLSSEITNVFTKPEGLSEQVHLTSLAP